MNLRLNIWFSTGRAIVIRRIFLDSIQLSAIESNIYGRLNFERNTRIGREKWWTVWLQCCSRIVWGILVDVLTVDVWQLQRNFVLVFPVNIYENGEIIL